MPKSDMPRWVEPQAPTIAYRIPTDNAWVHEVKHDGWRLKAYIEPGKVRLVSKQGRDWTAKFHDLAEALSKITGEAIIDGEVAVPDECGVTRLHYRPKKPTWVPCYYAFDLMWRNGKDLRPLTLLERKAELKKALAPAHRASKRIMYSDHVSGEMGPQLFKLVSEKGCEGIVSKRADAPYRGGPSRHWWKIKPLHIRQQQAEMAKRFLSKKR